MIFEDVLRDLVVSFNLVDTRVFLMRAPQVPAAQAITPYVVFTPVGPEPLYAHSGPLDLVRHEYQFSFVDTSQSRALALRESLRQRIDGLLGYFEGVTFGGVFLRSGTTSYEEDTRLYQAISSYLIQYKITGTLPALSTRQQSRQLKRKDMNP